MAGYSGKELSKKLGIKAGNRVATLECPDEVELGDMPDEVRVDRKLGMGPYHVMLLFVRSKAELTERFEKTRAKLNPDGGLWVCWPKKASGVETDLTEDVVREVALAQGLVDNKVCAIDDVWSGLRCVVRVADRPKKAAKS